MLEGSKDKDKDKDKGKGKERDLSDFNSGESSRNPRSEGDSKSLEKFQ